MGIAQGRPVPKARGGSHGARITRPRAGVARVRQVRQGWRTADEQPGPETGTQRLVTGALLLAFAALPFGPVADVPVSCLENLRGKVGRARVQVVIGTGALQETDAQRGLAHLLEHLVLRPLGYDDSNGTTALDYTEYHRDVTAGELQSATLDLLAQIRDPVLADEDFEAERQVVLRELEQARTSQLVRDRDPVFGEGLLSRDPGGSLGSVRNLTPQDARAFHAQHYVRGNLAIVLRGAADCTTLTATLTAALEAFPAGPAAALPEPGGAHRSAALGPDPNTFTGGFYWRRSDPTDRVVYRWVAIHLEQRALQVLRAERGLTYSPQARFLPRGPGGQILLTVQTQGSADEAADWLDEEVEALVTSERPGEVLAPAKKRLRETLELDAVQAALATIRGEAQPAAALGPLDDATLRARLPRLLAAERRFGSSVPQSNVASLVILGIFGIVVLGALYWAGRAFLGDRTR